MDVFGKVENQGTVAKGCIFKHFHLGPQGFATYDLGKRETRGGVGMMWDCYWIGPFGHQNQNSVAKQSDWGGGVFKRPRIQRVFFEMWGRFKHIFKRGTNVGFSRFGKGPLHGSAGGWCRYSTPMEAVCSWDGSTDPPLLQNIGTLPIQQWLDHPWLPWYDLLVCLLCFVIVWLCFNMFFVGFVILQCLRSVEPFFHIFLVRFLALKQDSVRLSEPSDPAP